MNATQLQECVSVPLLCRLTVEAMVSPRRLPIAKLQHNLPPEPKLKYYFLIRSRRVPFIGVPLLMLVASKYRSLHSTPVGRYVRKNLVGFSAAEWFAGVATDCSGRTGIANFGGSRFSFLCKVGEICIIPDSNTLLRTGGLVQQHV